VVVIIGILAMIAIPLYLDQRDKGKDAAVKEGVWAVQNAVVAYAADHDGLYPDPSQVAHDGEVAAYLDPWPENPFSGAPMANVDAYSPGDFHYDAWDGDVVAALVFVLPHYEHFGLIGWTSVEEEPYVARPLESTLLFASAFDSMEGLRVINGDWSLTEDGIAVAPNRYSGRLALGDPGWSDVRIDVSATLRSQGAYRIFYRWGGETQADGYVFAFDPVYRDRFIVHKREDGTSTRLGRASMPEGFDPYGAQHRIQIEVVGDRHTFTVDGETVLEVEDDTFSSGVVGLASVFRGDPVFHEAEVSEVAD